MKSLGFTLLAFVVVLIASVANGASDSRPEGCTDNVAILCAAGGGPPVFAKDTVSGACTRYDNRCLFNVFNCMKYRQNQPVLQEVKSC